MLLTTMLTLPLLLLLTRVFRMPLMQTLLPMLQNLLQVLLPMLRCKTPSTPTPLLLLTQPPLAMLRCRLQSTQMLLPMLLNQLPVPLKMPFCLD